MRIQEPTHAPPASPSTNSTDLTFWGPVVPRITSKLAHKVAAVRRRLLSLRTSRRERKPAVSKPGLGVVFTAALAPIVETAKPSASPPSDTALDITARLPHELLCRILDVVDFSLEELLPIRLLSQSWRAAAHAHPRYSRDIILRQPPREDLEKPDEVRVTIPLASFASRISCSERMFSLRLSAQFAPSATARAVIALIAQHLHRVQHLDVVFDPAHAPALFRALNRPAPHLESFSIKFGEVRFPDIEFWDIAPCHENARAIMPRTVFAGHAPRLHSLVLHNIAFPSSCVSVQESLYGAFLNVRYLTVVVTLHGCAPLADVLDICPSLQDLSISAHDACTPASHHFMRGARAIGYPVHPLRYLRIDDSECGAALPHLFCALAYPGMPRLTLVCPSDAAMQSMFSHLANSAGPLVFIAQEDTTNSRAYMSVVDPWSTHYARVRTVELAFDEWTYFERRRRINNMLTGGLLLIEPRIRYIHVSARNLHAVELCELHGEWTSVTVLRSDIVSAEDAEIVAAGLLPRMQSRFPRLELLLFYVAPVAPGESQLKVEDFARRAALRFFPRDARFVHAASTSLPPLADNIMFDTRITSQHQPQCLLWTWDRLEESADCSSVESLELDELQAV